MAPKQKQTTFKLQTIIEGNWVYMCDEHGDWQAINEKQGYQTRLKASLEWARKDVASRRLRKRLPNGEWDDLCINKHDKAQERAKKEAA